MKIHYFSLIFIILFLIFCSYFYSLFFPVIEEGFSIKLGHIYRPYVRKLRVYSENFYNNTTGNISTFFRKIGIA